MTEQGGIASIAGIFPHSVPNLPDGRLDLSLIKKAILPTTDYFSEAKVICLENTHNTCGGKVIGLDHMKELR